MANKKTSKVIPTLAIFVYPYYHGYRGSKNTSTQSYFTDVLFPVLRHVIPVHCPPFSSLGFILILSKNKFTPQNLVTSFIIR